MEIRYHICMYIFMHTILPVDMVNSKAAWLSRFANVFAKKSWTSLWTSAIRFGCRNIFFVASQQQYRSSQSSVLPIKYPSYPGTKVGILPHKSTPMTWDLTSPPSFCDVSTAARQDQSAQWSANETGEKRETPKQWNEGPWILPSLKDPKSRKG